MDSNDATGQAAWRAAADSMLRRAERSAAAIGANGFPHWADPRTGVWTTTPDGDWTGGAFPGIFWLGHKMTGESRILNLAQTWSAKLRPRANLETAFKGFGFYYGAALGDLLAHDKEAAATALEAATSLARQFDPVLGLIPLGRDAEEAGEVGSAYSSIDSLQATPLLFWAARHTGRQDFAECAAHHTTRVLQVHCRAGGSIVQSTELDGKSGQVIRNFTHKGFSDTSVWGRAQGWGMLYSAMAYAQDRSRTEWLAQSMAAADWWLAHVPADGVAYWDFDDPDIPSAPRDTAATAIACATLLRLAELAPGHADRQHYRDAAVATVRTLVERYLTRGETGGDSIGNSSGNSSGNSAGNSAGSSASPPAGMLIGGCFNKRADSRARDAITNAELIFGSYYLFECLQILGGTIEATEL